MLKILLDLSPNTGHKRNRFLQGFIKKNLKFVLSRKNDTIVFKFGRMLLPMKAGSILEKQGCKKYTLVD